MKGKKILFSAYSLDFGGIETALLNLINYLSNLGYDVTLVLEKKQGRLLDTLNKNVKVIEYSPSYNRIFGKAINAFKRFNFIRKYKNKFDCSFAYATYCKMASFTARTASENCNLWVHCSYLDIFGGDKTKYSQFFKELCVDKFRKIIFVSRKSQKEFENTMGKNNTVYCNNMIDGEKIIDLSSSHIDYDKKDTYTFLYVGRITEDSKKFSRLLEAVKELRDRQERFKVIVIGDGTYFNEAKQFVMDNKLEGCIEFVGALRNPYPYFKISDALILTSENEGNPVVFNEAKILKLPIVTTDVSDAKIEIDGNYGVVCEQNLEDIILKMSQAINGKVLNTQKFNYNEYNIEIKEKLDKIIQGK